MKVSCSLPEELELAFFGHVALAGEELDALFFAKCALGSAHNASSGVLHELFFGQSTARAECKATKHLPSGAHGRHLFDTLALTLKIACTNWTDHASLHV